LEYPFSWSERPYEEYLGENPGVITDERRPSTRSVFELEEKRFNRAVEEKRLVVMD